MEHRGRMNVYFAGYCLLLCLTALPASVAAQQTYSYLPKTCDNAFTPAQEIEVGKKAEQQVEKQMKVLPDSSPITKYVQRLGARLTAQAPGYRWPYSFHVVSAKEINAFALPGGAVFVNTGTLAAAENESEVAGVMAHEVSHVVLRHSTCNLTKQSKRNVGWGLAGILAKVFIPGVGGDLTQQGLGVVQGLSYLKMSRTDEEQADKLGMEILNHAGYNPHGMVRMFQIIQEKSNSGAEFLSDHPNPGNRIEYLNQELATLPIKPGAITNTQEFEEIHKLVQGEKASLVTGATGNTSALQADVPSSATVVNLQRTEFSLQYPENWKAYGDNQSGVMIAPDGGIYTDTSGKSQLAYGVIVGDFEPIEGTALTDATQQLITRLQRSNPQLSQNGDPETIQVNARDGRSVQLVGVSPLSTAGKQIAERDWLVTVKRPDGRLNYLIFVAPETKYSSLQPTFLGILHSFQLNQR